jgi:hypothetical protein
MSLSESDFRQQYIKKHFKQPITSKQIPIAFKILQQEWETYQLKNKKPKAPKKRKATKEQATKNPPATKPKRKHKKSQRKTKVTTLDGKSYSITNSGYKMGHYDSNIDRMAKDTPFGTSTWKKLLIGGCGSGKSSTSIAILKAYLDLGYFNIEDVYIVSPNPNDLHAQHLQGYNYYDSMFGTDEEGVSNIEQIYNEIVAKNEGETENPTHSIILLDDCLPELCANIHHPILVSLFTKDYHLSCSLLIMSQILSKELPTIIKKSLTGVVLMRGLTDWDISQFARFYFPISLPPKQLLQIYKQVTANNKKYGDKTKIRSNPLIILRHNQSYLDGFDPIDV